MKQTKRKPLFVPGNVGFMYAKSISSVCPKLSARTGADA